MERQDRWGTGRGLVSPAASALIPGYLDRRLDAGTIVSSPPALGPNNIGYFGDWVANKFYKFNFLTGQIIGSPVNVSEFVTSTPALYSANLAIFETDNPTNGMTFAYDTPSMTSVWSHPTGAVAIDERQHSSPTIGPDHNIVVANKNGDVYLWSPTTGNQVWHRTGYTSAARTVVFSRDDTTIYVANGTKMTALNYSDGSLLWGFDYGSAVGAPGVAPNGTVVFGTESGVVYGVNPVTGKNIWTGSATAGVHGAPAFDATGNCYVCSLDDHLYSIRVSDGHGNWSFSSDSACETAPAVDALGHIYFMNHNGNVYAVSPAGAQLWSINLGGESRGSLSIAPDDTLYVGVTGGANNGLAIIRQTAPSPAGVSLNPSTLYGGTASAGTVTLTANAPNPGTTVALGSSLPSVASVPSSVLVPAGTLSAPFKVTTFAVSAKTVVTITALIGSTRATATLTVIPPVLYSVTGAAAVAGHDSAGTVTLTGPIPTTQSVTLSSSNTAALQVPASVNVVAGQSKAAFTISTYGVATTTSVTLTATLNGVTRTWARLCGCVKNDGVLAPAASAEGRDSRICHHHAEWRGVFKRLGYANQQ
jgi:outer membrane protein assembly factor BamB